MANVKLRPDFRTSGGEVNDIVWNGSYVGTITLVYREEDRISGAIQLEDASLKARDKEYVVQFLQDYVQSLVDALDAKECDVVVTYSAYDRILADKNEFGSISIGNNEYFDVEEDHDYESDWIDTNTRFEDPDMTENDEISMKFRRQAVPYRKASIDRLEADTAAIPVFYELVAVGENRDSIEYHVYGKDREWVAEAFMRIDDRDVSGTVNWMHEPAEEEIEHVTDLIVSDFDENEIDTFVINMVYEREILETIELTHEELLAGEEWTGEEEVYGEAGWHSPSEEYTIVLARDDGDMLTYEIYQQSRGGLPIGTATIDISQRQLTGFIDFREEGSEDDREYIATLLMQELDKEKEYETINLTMLHRNEPIEEIMFQSEQVH